MAEWRKAEEHQRLQREKDYVMLLAEDAGRATGQGMWTVLEAGKSRETDFSPYRRTQLLTP